MRLISSSVVFVTLVCSLANAGELELQLGTVLGSESFCNLALDQGAIRAFIEKRVRPDDLDFASNLQMMAAGTKVENEAMSASEKTARCTQVQRTAKAYGFIK